MEDVVTGDRPPAHTLLTIMVDTPGKLTYAARKIALGEWRCVRRRHSLAFVVRTGYGPWLYWHDNAGLGDGWRCDWQTDLDSPNVNAWCKCPNAWTVCTAEPGRPPTLQ
jgi:hypothetical protein